MSQPPPDSSGNHRLDPADYIQQVEPVARARGFQVERYGEVAGHPLLALTKRAAGRRPRIYLSAGIHGNEPAPPLALLHLLEHHVFDARAVWFLCPLLNPVGFSRGTRENADGLDLNRDYKSRHAAETRAHIAWLERQPNFDLAICLHEDWEAGGFYVYELNPLTHRSAARHMLEAVAEVCPLETAAVIDGRPIDEPAIIRPLADPNLRELWPESIYLRAHHHPLGYTIETPSALPLATRIAALSKAITAAIRTVLVPGHGNHGTIAPPACG